MTTHLTWFPLVTAPALILALASCNTGDEGEADRPASEQSTPTSTTESAITPSNTGTPAPRKGEPGFKDLPACFRLRATILGSPGPDQIEGTRRDDVIVTLAGDDQVSGLRKEDRVCTGTGDDTVTDATGVQVLADLGTDDDTLDVTGLREAHAGPGDDQITVQDGLGLDVRRPRRRRDPRDRRTASARDPFTTRHASTHSATRPMRIDLARGHARGEGHDQLLNVRCVRGGGFGDTIVGTPLADDISLGRGENEVWSHAGNDVVYNDSAAGVDIYHLGPGNDSTMSGFGADRVYGGPGNDFVEASYGGDYVEGGTGNDTLHASYRCEAGTRAELAPSTPCRTRSSAALVTTICPATWATTGSTADRATTAVRAPTTTGGSTGSHHWTSSTTASAAAASTKVAPAPALGRPPTTSAAERFDHLWTRRTEGGPLDRKWLS